MDITRDNLHDMGNELRNKEGPGTLGARISKYIAENNNTNYVVDSVRHPEEAKALSSTKGYQFVLLATQASTKTRWERLSSRGRTGDCKTFEDFARNEAAELKNPDPNGQQVAATMALAKYTLSNDGTIDEFNAQLDKTWKQIQESSSTTEEPSTSTSS